MYLLSVSIINTSVKSLIPVDRKSDDISTHKFVISGTPVTPKVESTVSSTSITFCDTNSLRRDTVIFSWTCYILSSCYHLQWQSSADVHRAADVSWITPLI